MPSGAARMRSTPRGKRARFCFHCSTKWRGSGAGAIVAVRLDARAFEQQPVARRQARRPAGSASSSGRDIPACLARNSRARSGSAGSATSAKCASAGVSASGAPVWKPSQVAHRRRLPAAPGRARAACRGRRASARRRPRSATAAAAARRAPRPAAWCPAAPWRPSRRGTPPARRTPDRRSRRRSCSVRASHQSSPRTMVKKSTLVAAVSARRLASAAAAASRSGATTFASTARAGRFLPQRVERSRRAAPSPCRGRAHRRGRSAPDGSRTVARVTVASPMLKGAPPPPIRPRTVTRPVSGPRSSFGFQRQTAPRRKAAASSSRGRRGKGRHGGLARRVGLAFLSSFMASSLASHRYLSIDIDNHTNYTRLLTRVHDGSMTGREK